MRGLVDDTSTYARLKSDPTTKFQTANNNIARRLKDLKLIDFKTAKDLTTYNAICPRIYGQPKAHKPELPLRPVIPNITAPTYQLAKYIAGILQRSFHSPYNITNSFEFSELVNKMQIPEGYIMISLDVVSLFTNVPRDLVRKNIIERWREVDTNINLDMFLEIVELCMESSYFCYEGQFFMQTYGTAMGSPLSPILADIVLDSVINRALSTLPFESPIFKKYVDDIFMVIPQQTIQLVLEAFNRIEPRLQFTVEVEKEGKLPFLDMTVIRKDSQELTTEWYAKPIASGRMLNYRSFHQPRYKMNVANNFIHRVHKLTHNKSEEEIAATIRDHLRRNNYPKQLVNRLLNLYKAKRFSTPSSTPDDQPSSLRLPTASPPRLPPPAPPPTATSSAAPPPPTIPSCQPSCQLPMTPQDNTSSRPFCQQTSPPSTNDYQSSHNTQQGE
ncbi:hypothetical protein RP20_CCG027072 [Aedes albopictus]|nr:hypothetical protein RP20_CCG027072 [Aedes albopictus]